MTQERRRVLWKARTMAKAALARRHPEEFIELKNEALTKLGEPTLGAGYGGRPKESPGPRAMNQAETEA